ncbi:hypothetical protein TWF718_009413 [Orbilia javanica]|uniref:Uncharacterized protein n=1 Tax=Orbilia javanica TaxID=47235 RepID=A0AAN8MV79_9PEZI
MLRLSGSQVLLTNRDVTRTLNPKRARRPPTYLYTKGKQPIRSSPYPAPSIPHIDTSRPSASAPSTSTARQRNGIAPSSLAPVRSSSPDWSLSSDTEVASSSSASSSSSSSDSNMQEQPILPSSTDGAEDETTANYVGEMGSFRQVVSLETIDSFPFLPYRPPPSLMFRIHEDPAPPMPNLVRRVRTFDPYDNWSPQPFPYLSIPLYEETYAEDTDEDDEDFENYDENAWAGDGDGDGMDENEDEDEDEDDGEEEVIILNETIWDPDTMILAEIQTDAPLQNDGAPAVAAERPGFPPTQ